MWYIIISKVNPAAAKEVHIYIYISEKSLGHLGMYMMHICIGTHYYTLFSSI